MAERERESKTVITLKTLGVAAAAGAAQAVSEQLPDLLPSSVGTPVAVAVAAVIGYLLRSPLQPRERR